MLRNVCDALAKGGLIQLGDALHQASHHVSMEPETTLFPSINGMWK